MPLSSAGGTWVTNDTISAGAANLKSVLNILYGTFTPSVGTDTVAGQICVDRTNNVLYVVNGANNAYGLAFNQSLRTTDSPTFAGLTITGYSGVAKFSAGVVAGSATMDDIADGVTYVRSHNDFTSTYKGYLNQSVQTGASPTFVNLTLTGQHLYITDVTGPQAGIVTEVNNQLLDYGGNYDQLGGRNTAKRGAYFRIDLRDGYIDQLFSIYDIEASGSEKLVFKLSTTGDIVAAGSLTIATDSGGAKGVTIGTNVPISTTRLKILGSSDTVPLTEWGDGGVVYTRMVRTSGNIMEMVTANYGSYNFHFVGNYEFDSGLKAPYLGLGAASSTAARLYIEYSNTASDAIAFKNIDASGVKWHINNNAGASKLTFTLDAGTSLLNLDTSGNLVATATVSGTGWVNSTPSITYANPWVGNATTTRAFNVSYQNTSGKTIVVYVGFYTAANASAGQNYAYAALGPSSANTNIEDFSNATIQQDHVITVIVPNGWYYEVITAGTVTLINWIEQLL